MTFTRVSRQMVGLYKSLPTFFSLLVFFLYSSSLVFADAKSDYDYQYGQYRQNYIEYTILKQDYLGNSTLDNQQKAMLAAKQSIVARELAKASLAWYLSGLIQNNQVAYTPIKPLADSLETARAFFLDQSQKAQGVVTQADLKSYTANYLSATVTRDQSFRYGIIINKIAKLVRIQIDSQTAFDDLLPKLPAPLPTTLNERISELKSMKVVIDQKIATLANSLDPVLGEENVDSEIFFTARIEKLNEIRSLQLEWVNRLIDIDTNYVQTKN